MAGYTPNRGPAGKERKDVGSRNTDGQGSSPRQPNDHQISAKYGTPDQRVSQKPQNVRNRRSLAGQIRSLEKLLKHPGTKMSANVRQEKGRELAALVLERERKKAKLRATKNLGKYHMVRFVERQKCERSLRQLRKSLVQVQDSRRRASRKAKDQTANENPDSDVDAESGAVLPNAQELHLEQRIKQTEVDLNYTIYAPLGEKYISLFPPTGKEKISGMSGMSKSFLKPEEEAEVRTLKDDNVVRNATGERPPMWFRVEECMQNGTLEQLRDGKLTAAPVATLPQVRGKGQAPQSARSPPNWLHDDGVTAAEDLDSDKESDDDDGKIDGGFFEPS